MGLFRRDPPPPPPLVRRARTVPYTQALTASAKVLLPASGDPRKQDKIKVEPWQRDAWNYYDLVGELWYAANFYGGCLSRVILTPGLRQRDGRIGGVWGDEDDEGNPIPLHPWAGIAADLLEDLRSPVGGQAAILRSLGVNLAVAGEAYLLGQDDETVQTSKRWEVLSVEELQKGEGVGKYKRGDEEIDEETSLVARVWRPHPRKSKQADASTKALLEILEELVILTRGVRATATSRLAGAGVYWVPEEIDYPGDEDDDTSEEAQGTKPDPFTTDLIRAMVTPISDKGSAAAVVPMVVRAPADYIEKIRFDDFTRSFDSYPSVALRKEAVERFAQGIDLPVEIVTGQGGANHWSAWQIDEQTFKAHIEPMLTLICDGLTGGYLVPGLLASGAKPEEITDLVVHYDAAELVTHPNQSADATQAFDRVAIRGATYRRVLGFTEDDAPDEDEVEERLRVALGMRGTGQAAPAGGTGATPGGSPSEVQPGTPSTGEATSGNLAALTAAAAQVAIERAIERAGAKVRGRVNGRREVRDAINGLEARRVCAQLGPALTSEIVGEADLFAGEFAVLGRSVTEWARAEGRKDAPEVAGRVVAATERLARSRLYSPERVSISPADFFEAVTPRE